MTHTENSIVIAAPAATIYSFAAATERWPMYLPHYRYVHVLEQRGNTRVLEMGASRDGIPIQWVAEQTNDPVRPAITFRHIRGWTRGMEVEWRFEPLPGGLTRVTILHDLAFRFPIAADFFGEHIVGNFFVANVAGKTLARIKTLAEGAV
jgi:ribosome-associated toxin RatA of RatAB toxin-antitoxin module